MAELPIASQQSNSLLVVKSLKKLKNTENRLNIIKDKDGPIQDQQNNRLQSYNPSREFPIAVLKPKFQKEVIYSPKRLLNIESISNDKIKDDDTTLRFTNEKKKETSIQKAPIKKEVMILQESKQIIKSNSLKSTDTININSNRSGPNLKKNELSNDRNSGGGSNILNNNGNSSLFPAPNDNLTIDEEKKMHSAVVLKEEILPDFRDPEFFICIERDYTGQHTNNVMTTRFLTDFPIELKTAISEKDFKSTIDEVNTFFEEAEELMCKTTMDSILSFFTCTLINLCRRTRMQKVIEKAFEEIGDFLYFQNDEIYHPVGLHVVHPMCRGLRMIVIRSIAKYPLYKYKS